MDVDERDDDAPSTMAYGALRSLLLYHPVAVDLHCFHLLGIPHDAIQRVAIENYQSFEDEPASRAFKFGEADFVVLSLTSPDSGAFERGESRRFITIGPGMTTLRQVVEFLMPPPELIDMASDESMQAVFGSKLRSRMSSSSSSYSAQFSAPDTQVVRLAMNAMPTTIQSVVIYTSVKDPHSAKIHQSFVHIINNHTDDSPEQIAQSQQFFQTLKNYDFKTNQLLAGTYGSTASSFLFGQSGRFHYNLRVAGGWNDTASAARGGDEPYFLDEWMDTTVFDIIRHFARYVDVNTRFARQYGVPGGYFETTLRLYLSATPATFEPNFATIMNRTTIMPAQKAKPLLMRSVPYQFGSYSLPFTLMVHQVNSYYDYVQSWEFPIRDTRALREAVPPHTQPITLTDLLFSPSNPLPPPSTPEKYIVVPPFSATAENDPQRQSMRLFRLSATPLLQLLTTYRVEANEDVPKSKLPGAPKVIYEMYIMKIRRMVVIRVFVAPYRDIREMDVERLPARDIGVPQRGPDVTKSFINMIRAEFRQCVPNPRKPSNFCAPLPEAFESADRYTYAFRRNVRGGQVMGQLNRNDPTTIQQLLDRDGVREAFYEEKERFEHTPTGTLHAHRVTYYHLLLIPNGSMPSFNVTE